MLFFLVSASYFSYIQYQIIASIMFVGALFFFFVALFKTNLLMPLKYTLDEIWATYWNDYKSNYNGYHFLYVNNPLQHFHTSDRSR